MRTWSRLTALLASKLFHLDFGNWGSHRKLRSEVLVYLGPLEKFSRVAWVCLSAGEREGGSTKSLMTQANVLADLASPKGFIGRVN